MNKRTKDLVYKTTLETIGVKMRNAGIEEADGFSGSRVILLFFWESLSSDSIVIWSTRALWPFPFSLSKSQSWGLHRSSSSVFSAPCWWPTAFHVSSMSQTDERESVCWTRGETVALHVVIHVSDLVPGPVSRLHRSPTGTDGSTLDSEARL